MKLTNTLITLSFVLVLTASVGYCLEEYQESSDYDMILNRMKRKGGGGGGRGGGGGGRGGGGRGGGRGSGGRRGMGRSRGSSGGSKSSSRSRSKPANPYPKQPPFNPNNYPSAPKQPGQHSYPYQQYPGQTGNYPKYDHGQSGYGNNYNGKTSGLGGTGLGLAVAHGELKGTGGLGSGLAGSGLGAAAGAYGGYKLGKIVGHLGRGGHYGYFNDRHTYVRCDPPPKIEVDSETNITYIPKTVTYDARCEYYDQEPPKYHPYYSPPSVYYMNAAVSITGCPTALTTLLTVISVLLAGNVVNRFRANGLTQLLIK